MLKELDLRGKDEKETRLALPRPLLDSRVENALTDVREIIREVREGGDEALYEITERFDGCRLESLSIGRNEMIKALEEIPSSLKSALEKSAENVQAYYSKQGHKDFAISQDGMRITVVRLITLTDFCPTQNAWVFVPHFCKEKPKNK